VQKFLLDVLLPFHVDDDLLMEAVESCLEALPKNSKLILINTEGSNKTHYGKIPNVTEISMKGADYLSALKFGLMGSEAEYVALMNSDDLVEETRFARQLEVLSKSNADICVTNISKFAKQSDGSRLSIPPLLGVPPRYFHEGILLLGSFRADASWLFKRDWAIRNNLFFEACDVSDWSTAMRVMKKTNTVVISENLYFYRMHSRQSSHDKKLHQKDDFYETWQKLNTQLNLRSLSRQEIQILTSNYDTPKVKSLKNLMKWLYEAEDQLRQEFPRSESLFLENLFSRRRLLICFKNHSFRIRLKDLKFLPKILFEYFTYRRYLRGSL
jgi:hypothetical protein